MVLPMRKRGTAQMRDIPSRSLHKPTKLPMLKWSWSLQAALVGSETSSSMQSVSFVRYLNDKRMMKLSKKGKYFSPWISNLPHGEAVLDRIDVYTVCHIQGINTANHFPQTINSGWFLANIMKVFFYESSAEHRDCADYEFYPWA